MSLRVACPKRPQLHNADFWLSGATHLHTWKKIIINLKKVKKSKFFEIKDDQVLYLCIIFPLGNYFHCNLEKKQNCDEYKVNSTSPWGYSSFFTQDKIKVIS
jgi:hypothetical protein